MIQTIQFVCPRAVSAGELVMDPNTGRWGYAKTHYAGGQMGTFSAGAGYVVSVPGTVSEGSPLYCGRRPSGCTLIARRDPVRRGRQRDGADGHQGHRDDPAVLKP